MAKKRSFKKLREHLTSNEVDKKISYLESRMPTNNTAFVFGGDPGNPQGNSFETIVDGETDSTDYTVGENPTNSTEARDTSGLFNPSGDHSKGEYVKTEEPPGDTSYILGPMAAMYYTWSYPWTMIGYIRESDRRMVNLGRIDGKFSDWNGSVGNANSGSGTFYSYGQLTTEQALWFRDIQKAFGNTNDPDTYSYRAFYPGPPSATPDAYGRYPCILTGVSKKTARTVPDATPLDKQAGDNFSAMNAKKKREEGEEVDDGELDNDLSSKDMDDYLNSLPDSVRNDLINGRALPDYTLDTLLLSLLPQTRVLGTAMSKINMAARALDKWWNKGRNVRVKGESTANWKDLMRDDLAQRGKSDLNFQSGKPGNPFGRPDQAFNIFRPASKGGPASGPTPAVRQAFERFFKLGFSKANQKSTQKESISLERKREIFGHLTKPVVLPETKQKTYKVSPGQRYKNKNKKPETNFQDMDKLFNKNIGGPEPFKPQERTSWTKDFIRQNTMQSQEKMNGVLEMIGDGKHAFDYATNEYKKMGVKELEQYWGKNPNMYSFLFNGKKYNVTRKEHIENDSIVFMEDQKGVKSNMLQSELNEKLQEQNEKWIEEAYFKSHPVIPEKEESTYELIKRRFLENKKIAPEFPAEPPPQMVNGFHPEYGKKANRYKKLDPASANAMPLTGDPETDEIVRKQKTINKIKSMRKKA